MGAPSPPSTGSIQGAGTTLGNQQQGINTQSQYGSNYNQSNPYGSLNYVQTGTGPNGQPQYTAIENLSPQQQQLLNTYTGTQNVAGLGAQGVLQGAQYGTVPAATAIGNETSGLTGQFMNQWLAGTEPFFQTQQSQLNTQLANEGLGGPTNANPAGSPAWQNAQRQLQTNQGYAVAQQATAAENQAYNQALQTYNEPAQLATSLAQFAAPTTPNASFNQGAQIQPADLAAALSAEIPAYMQPYSAQYQQYANLMGGLFGLGGAGLKGLTTLA
jgi:hypothetical protein